MPDAVPCVFVVVTNHGEIDKRPATGVWFTEFSEPYTALTGAGAVATVASPLGGPAPVDPRGKSPPSSGRGAPADQVEICQHRGQSQPFTSER